MRHLFFGQEQYGYTDNFVQNLFYDIALISYKTNVLTISTEPFAVGQSPLISFSVK